MWPARTGRRPEIALIRVDFPAPFAPTSATIEPSLTVRSMSRTTVVLSYPAASPRTSSIGRLRSLADVGFNDARVLLDYAWRAACQNATGVEDDDLVGNTHDERHIVLDHHDRDAAVSDGTQNRREFGRLLVVESRCRLVEEQQTGSCHERAYHLEQLLCAHRQRGRSDIPERRQPNQFEQRLRLADKRAFLPLRAW